MNDPIDNAIAKGMQELARQGDPVVVNLVSCAYCNRQAELVGGDVIYPHRKDLVSKRFWRCAPCGAYVGCHGNTDHPLGRLANAELRAAKMRAHAAFDPMWRRQKLRRSEAYRRLADFLGITPRECHIGMFDVAQCARVVEFAKERL